MRHTYDLIQVATDDSLLLNGLFQPGNKAKTAVILVHGFTSDFYTHPFYHTIADALKKQGNALLLAQTRGTGLHTEFIKGDNQNTYIGSYFERIEESHLDISAFVEFLLADGYTQIALAGHSLGTIKAVRYLFEGKHKAKIAKLILLSPFDKNAFMEQKAPKTWPTFLLKAQQMIDDGKGEEIVPIPLWEDYPMSYQTFLSWYNQSDLSCVWDFYRKNYDFPVLQKITIPTQVTLGEKDAFIDYGFGISPAKALEIIKKHLPGVQTTLIPGADHTYTGKEAELAKEVAEFLKGEL